MRPQQLQTGHTVPPKHGKHSTVSPLLRYCLFFFFGRGRFATFSLSNEPSAETNPPCSAAATLSGGSWVEVSFSFHFFPPPRGSELNVQQLACIAEKLEQPEGVEKLKLDKRRSDCAGWADGENKKTNTKKQQHAGTKRQLWHPVTLICCLYFFFFFFKCAHRLLQVGEGSSSSSSSSAAAFSPTTAAL